MRLVAEPIPSTDAAFRAGLAEAKLPADDLDLGGRRFFRFVADGRTVGYGGFEPHGDHALIRSVVVLPEARWAGYGRAIADLLAAEAPAEILETPQAASMCTTAPLMRLRISG